jgi:hypothetical protein
MIIGSGVLFLEPWHPSRILPNWLGSLNASAAWSTRKLIEPGATKPGSDTVAARAADRDSGEKLSKNSSSLRTRSKS